MKVELEDYNNYRTNAINFLVYTSNKKLDKYTAEDIFQDSYFNFSKNLDKINNNNISLKNYILTICKNTYLQGFSKSRHKSLYCDKKKILKDLELKDDWTDIKYGIVNNLSVSKFEVQEIYSEIDGLKDERYSNILKLSIEGYSRTEIENIKQLSLNIVDVGLKTSKNILRKQLNIKKYYCTSNRIKNYENTSSKMLG